MKTLYRWVPFIAGLALAGAAQAKDHHMPKEGSFKIVIETVDHNAQRYDTVGDWRWISKNKLHVTVSRMGNRNYEFLVGLHELLEAYLCQHDKVSQEEVDAFDMGPGKDLDEPGDSPRAPYFFQHKFASAIERRVAHQLDVDWYAYDEAVKGVGK